MKATVGLLVSAIVGLLGLPLLANANQPDTPRHYCGDIAAILDTIRTLESGGNYQAKAPGSTAAGAYQMIDTTWAHWSTIAGHAGRYETADKAPPAVQDAAAEAFVRSVLNNHDGDVTYVPLHWYYPAAITNPALMDKVPFPQAGNTHTPRQYQKRWLDLYDTKNAEAPSCETATNSAMALPVPRTLLEQNPGAVDAPHHDYPAWDFPTPVGTPIYAIEGGTVIHTSNRTDNCYHSSCVDACGTGITIASNDNTTWTYCHGSTLDVSVGEEVEPGRLIMRSGNTGRSNGPHLHLSRRVDGKHRCPQPILRNLLDRPEHTGRSCVQGS